MGLPVLTDSIEGYLADVNRYPVLSREEEYEIADRYYRLGRVEDAHRLVTSNLRYVVKIALEFRSYGCRLADLIQEGNIGLMVAVKKFNPYKGFRLITYATWWIRSFMQDFIVKTRGLVRHNTKALKKKLFYRKDDAIARAEAAMTSGGYDLSLNAEISPERDAETTHLDLLTDERTGPLETCAAKEEQAKVKSEVSDALAVLNERERLVIEKRVMAEKPESLQGLGDRLGLTRERVRQIENAAKKKLRNILSRSPGSAARTSQS